VGFLPRGKEMNSCRKITIGKWLEDYLLLPMPFVCMDYHQCTECKKEAKK